MVTSLEAGIGDAGIGLLFHHVGDGAFEARRERRVDEAARHVDIAQLGICPQCGFSTNLFGTDFTIDVERRKLALLVETAAEIWGA